MINLRYTSLGQMLLADALRRVVFTPEDVRQAILLNVDALSRNSQVFSAAEAPAAIRL